MPDQQEHNVDQALADLTPGEDDVRSDPEWSKDRADPEGNDDHGVPGELLELHTALEAQEAGLL